MDLKNKPSILEIQYYDLDKFITGKQSYKTMISRFTRKRGSKSYLGKKTYETLQKQLRICINKKKDTPGWSQRYISN